MEGADQTWVLGVQSQLRHVIDNPPVQALSLPPPTNSRHRNVEALGVQVAGVVLGSGVLALATILWNLLTQHP